MKVATTEYSTLYKENYFAHKPGSSSFDQQTLPGILADFCRWIGVDLVMDIGAGSGLLGSLLSSEGIGSFDVDIMERAAPNFFQANLGSPDIDLPHRLRQASAQYRAGRHLLTCFDVAEHIDIEHVADFIYNLGLLIDQYGIISISTRPSSQANLFHCTILPIDTWKYMFGLLGLEVSMFEPLQLSRSFQQFHSDSRELFAVSFWQKRNLFRDDGAHQHYLQLHKTHAITVDRNIFRARISEALDIRYRREKRERVADLDLPYMVYHLSFAQDWPFLRSLLDVWPPERVHVLIRRDLLVPAYRELIESLLQRLNVAVVVHGTVGEAEDALDRWSIPPGSLFITATEGLPTIAHGLGSLTALSARRRGLTTLCLQHGHLLPEHLAMGSQFFGAVDSDAVEQFERAVVGLQTCAPIALGSPKHLDGNQGAIDADAISFRLGSYAKHFRKRVLVGSNLHWGAHRDAPSSTLNWLEAALRRYPDILFIWRPHPDDQTALASSELASQPNLMIIDEALLLCIDWPISRILSAVDMIVSTHSTLIEDALAAGMPTALLSTSIADARSSQVEKHWQDRGLAIIQDGQLADGLIPEELLARGRTVTADPTSVNSPFFSDLCALTAHADDPARLAEAEQAVQQAFLGDCRNLNLDAHPHANRAAMIAQLKQFVSGDA